MHACTCVTSDQMHECGLLDPGPVGIHVTMLQGAWNPPCAAQGAAPPPLISSLNLLPNCRIQPRPRSVPRETQRAPCLSGFKKRGRFIVGEAVTPFRTWHRFFCIPASILSSHVSCGCLIARLSRVGVALIAGRAVDSPAATRGQAPPAAAAQPALGMRLSDNTLYRNVGSETKLDSGHSRVQGADFLLSETVTSRGCDRSSFGGRVQICPCRGLSAPSQPM